MTIQEWINIITQAGFPIAACIFLFKTNNQMLTKFQEAINNNTKAIEQLKLIVENLTKDKGDKEGK